MKILCKYESDSEINEDNSNYNYNISQLSVGSALKTLNGSWIRRFKKYDVGKYIKDCLYVHKQYAPDVIPSNVWTTALDILHQVAPNFEYNCIRYGLKTQSVCFQEAPDFDYAREPVVGDYITVDTNKGVAKKGHSNSIWHHKWLWVKNDYSGFDVRRSWLWSKKWLSALTEPSAGQSLNQWNMQLDRFELPHDIAESTRIPHRYIQGAESIGTTFYSADLKTVQEVLKSNHLNLFAQYSIDEYGWDAIDFKHNLFGSEVIDDILYICVTDGQDINIEGKSVDPESALTEYDVSSCEDYIQEATDDIILKHITVYEVIVDDIDTAALELLKQGESFEDLMEAAQELDL